MVAYCFINGYFKTVRSCLKLTTSVRVLAREKVNINSRNRKSLLVVIAFQKSVGPPEGSERRKLAFATNYFSQNWNRANLCRVREQTPSNYRRQALQPRTCPKCKMDVILFTSRTCLCGCSGNLSVCEEIGGLDNFY